MLAPPLALHTAARRYCIEQAAQRRDQYQALIREAGGESENVPRDRALGSYPRYQILEAILVEVERMTGTEFASLDDAYTGIMEAAGDAYREETRPPDLVVSEKQLLNDLPALMERMKELGPRAKVVSRTKGADKDDRVRDDVMHSEVTALEAYIRSLTAPQLNDIEPLPFRRTLEDGESDRLRLLMKQRWGVEDEWYPLDRARDAEPPPSTVAFQSKPFFTQELVSLVWRTLQRLDVNRVYEIREGSAADHEIEVESLRPWYDFNEGYWMDDSADWLIYASHEGSTTVAGEQFVQLLKASWLDWEKWIFWEVASGVSHEVGPGVYSTGMNVEPPKGWRPPGDEPKPSGGIFGRVIRSIRGNQK